MSSLDHSGISFAASLTEAVIWCTVVADPTRPKDSLRSDANRPDWFDSLDGFVGTVVSRRASNVRQEYWLNKKSQLAGRNEIHEGAASLARELLRESFIRPGSTHWEHETRCLASTSDLLGGKILIYRPHENLCDGAAELETQGFYDVDNIPPWDTWIGYSPENYQNSLICYIPGQFVWIAQRGIDVNPEGCIGWLDEKIVLKATQSR